jgi:hypothetical protein
MTHLPITTEVSARTIPKIVDLKEKTSNPLKIAITLAAMLIAFISGSYEMV